MSAARELMLRLATTGNARSRDATPTRELARRADFDELYAALEAEGLLPLLGGRLVDAAGDLLPPGFREEVQLRRDQYHVYATAVEMIADRALDVLRDGGVPAAALKGPALARSLHGDLGLRRTSDIDLLVAAHAYGRAVELLAERGWGSVAPIQWRDGLPLFEATLRSAAPGVPDIDLHWRVDWYDEAFSQRLLAHLGGEGDGNELELAALLVFWARDGFWGLRHGVDVAAWWDRFGPVMPAGCLEAVAEHHPALEPTLCVAAIIADRLLGLPSAQLFDERRLRRRRRMRATRMARLVSPARAPRYTALGKERDPTYVTQVALMDWLLSPAGYRFSAVRRHVLLPRDVLAAVYGHPPGSRPHQALARLRYAALVGGELAARSVPLLWRARHDELRSVSG
jgi:hypothetical protein